MNGKFVRFYAGNLLRFAVRCIRLVFFPLPDRPAIAVVVKPGAALKVADLMERLKFYLPNSDSTAVRLVSRLPCRELATGIVLVLDQQLVPRNWYRVCDNIFNVDFQRNPIDGWQLCAIAEYVAGLPNTSRTRSSRHRFFDHLDRVGKLGHERTYAFGTGTSLAGAIDKSYDDGYRVVCNTIVRDPELWHHLKPHIVVAGDAIYHFGFTEFARAFRRDLCERLRESKGSVLFVYPAVFDAVVQRELSEFSDVLCPVESGGHDRIEVDLRQDFHLPLLGNVLNQLLLPVSCTLSKSVWLWGFDGRAPTDKLFWSNSTKHSYPELMPHLLSAHPAFYETLVPKDNEESYVKAVHGDELEQRLQRAEAAGYEFVMMHRSWTETLQRRYAESRI